MAVLSAHTVQDCTIEMVCAGGGSRAWQAVLELATLRELVRDLGKAKALPNVVLRAGASPQEQGISVVANHVRDGTCEREVLCSGPDVGKVCEKLQEIAAEFSTVTFWTSQDRPGLLAEVSALLKVRGTDIRGAEISTDAATGGAVHRYRLVESCSGKPLSDDALTRLESDFCLLRDADPALRRMLATVPSYASGASLLHPSPDAAVSAPRSAICEVDEATEEYAVAIQGHTCSSGDIWRCAADPEVSALRNFVQELSGMRSLPSMVLHPRGGRDPDCRFAILSLEQREHRMLCSGATIEEVKRAFNEKVDPSSSVTFSTDRDRPGMLADVSALLKLHGANIRSADVTTDDKRLNATHVYRIVDATTGRRMSREALSRLQADFAVLSGADPALRQLLARGG